MNDGRIRRWMTRLGLGVSAFLRCGVVLALLSFVTNVSAQNELPRLADNAPDTYTVERGDTLWDISALFLNEPWRWPELWRVNPAVRDPNLIYPGDKLYLRWEQGKPGVYLSPRGPRPGVTVLSPKIRSEPLGFAIPEIPRDVIDPFIAKHRFATDFNPEGLPRVIGGGDGRLISGMGDRVYVAGELGEGQSQFDVVRSSQQLVDPETGEDLGTLLRSVGRVSLSKRGSSPTEASQFDVSSSSEELRTGDLLLPVQDGELVALYKPREPSEGIKTGVMMSLESGVSQIGALDIVATNLGAEDGVELGNIFSTAKFSSPLKDPVSGAYYSLPLERSGTLMLFAVYERASFGLVLGATQPLSVGDKLISP